MHAPTALQGFTASTPAFWRQAVRVRRVTTALAPPKVQLQAIQLKEGVAIAVTFALKAVLE